MKKFRDAIGRVLVHPASFSAAFAFWAVQQGSTLSASVNGQRRDADGMTGAQQYAALVSTIARLEKIDTSAKSIDARLKDATDPDLAPTYPENTAALLTAQREKLRMEFAALSERVPVDIMLSRAISSQDARDLGTRLSALPGTGQTLPPAAGSNALRRCQDAVQNHGPREETALKIANCLENPPRQKSDVTAGFTFAALAGYGLSIIAVRRRKQTAALRRR